MLIVPIDNICVDGVFLGTLRRCVQAQAFLEKTTRNINIKKIGGYT